MRRDRKAGCRGGGGGGGGGSKGQVVEGVGGKRPGQERWRIKGAGGGGVG